MSSLAPSTAPKWDRSALERSRKNRRVCVLLAAFGDESHDEALKSVFAVSGLIGSQDDWDVLKSMWTARTGGKVFHATECDTDTGDYKGIEHKVNKALYADLAKLIAASRLMGFGACVDVADYRSSFTSDYPEAPYFLCFFEIIRRCADIAYLSVPQETVEFTFDRHFDREYNATFLYDYMVHLPESRLTPFLADKVSFATRNTVEIQVADLVARETMKHRHNQIGPVKRDMRKSMKALADTKRFQFIYFTKADFEVMKRRMVDMALPGSTMTEYRAWLSGFNVDDSMTNRIRYLRVMDGFGHSGRMKR